MIDYLFAFPDEATAQADPVIGTYYVDGSWRGDVCLPGVVAIIIATSFPLDTAWRLIIGLSERDSNLDSLQPPVLELIADRDSAEIIFSNLPLDQLPAFRLNCMFDGSNYQFGGPIAQE